MLSWAINKSGVCDAELSPHRGTQRASDHPRVKRRGLATFLRQESSPIACGNQTPDRIVVIDLNTGGRPLCAGSEPFSGEARQPGRGIVENEWLGSEPLWRDKSRSLPCRWQDGSDGVPSPWLDNKAGDWWLR